MLPFSVSGIVPFSCLLLLLSEARVDDVCDCGFGVAPSVFTSGAAFSSASVFTVSVFLLSLVPVACTALGSSALGTSFAAAFSLSLFWLSAAAFSTIGALGASDEGLNGLPFLSSSILPTGVYFCTFVTRSSAFVVAFFSTFLSLPFFASFSASFLMSLSPLNCRTRA